MFPLRRLNQSCSTMPLFAESGLMKPEIFGGAEACYIL